MAKTILVADDSVTIRKVVEWTFHETDIRVEMVSSGREALERLTTIRPDLVLVDVVMPAPTGYEICRSVKDSDHPVPVLLLTGTFEPFDEARAEACGADGHVVKPFESRALLRRVEDLLASPRPAVRAAVEAATPHSELDAVLDEIASDPAFSEPPAAAPTADELIESLLRERSATGEARAETPAVAMPAVAELSDDDIARIAKLVLAQLSDRIVREIAWEVVPDLAEAIIRERIRHFERLDDGPA